MKMLRSSTVNCGQILLKLNNIQKFNTNRYLHVTCDRRPFSTLKFFRRRGLYHHSENLVSFIRHASTNEKIVQSSEPLKQTLTTEATNDTIRVETNIKTSATSTSSADSNTAIFDDLPDIPTPTVTEEIIEAVQKFHPNGEITLDSLGLGGWSPIGIIQNITEYFHISLNLPWWGAIAIGTVCIRLLMFPLVIKAQRNAAKMQNVMPKIQELQAQLTEARLSGNQYEASLRAVELYNFMKKEGVSPLKSCLVIAVQAPVFISFFTALRQMANAPVESMKTGGLWWFTDLTVPDPYYILPLMTAVTVYVTFEVGADAIQTNAMGNLKYVFRALPIIIFPFTINFPAAILCYWTSSNFVSLVQAIVLRTPKLRAFFQIPAIIKHDESILPVKNKGFIGGVKESWTNMKIAQQLADRDRLDLIQFENAGRSPIKKTYKFDPTKQNKNSKPTVLAKKQ